MRPCGSSQSVPRNVTQAPCVSQCVCRTKYRSTRVVVQKFFWPAGALMTRRRANLPQIVRDGCAPSQGLPSRTFNHFLHTSAHFAVSSFFDQCTGGELLVNCRRSECDRSNGVHLSGRSFYSRTRLRDLVSGIFDHPSRTYCYGAGRSVYSEDPLTYNSLLSFAPSPWFVNENNWQLSHLPTCLHRSLYDFA